MQIAEVKEKDQLLDIQVKYHVYEQNKTGNILKKTRQPNLQHLAIEEETHKTRIQ
jgi:hypothetical protein